MSDEKKDYRKMGDELRGVFWSCCYYVKEAEGTDLNNLCSEELMKEREKEMLDVSNMLWLPYIASVMDGNLGSLFSQTGVFIKGVPEYYEEIKKVSFVRNDKDVEAFDFYFNSGRVLRFDLEELRKEMKEEE